MGGRMFLPCGRLGGLFLRHRLLHFPRTPQGAVWPQYDPSRPGLEGLRICV